MSHTLEITRREEFSASHRLHDPSLSDEENVALYGVEDDLVNEIFDFMTRDFSERALQMVLNQDVSEAQEALFMDHERMLAERHTQLDRREDEVRRGRRMYSNSTISEWTNSARLSSSFCSCSSWKRSC